MKKTLYLLIVMAKFNKIFRKNDNYDNIKSKK